MWAPIRRIGERVTDFAGALASAVFYQPHRYHQSEGWPKFHLFRKGKRR